MTTAPETVDAKDLRGCHAAHQVVRRMAEWPGDEQGNAAKTIRTPPTGRKPRFAACGALARGRAGSRLHCACSCRVSKRAGFIADPIAYSRRHPQSQSRYHTGRCEPGGIGFAQSGHCGAEADRGVRTQNRCRRNAQTGAGCAALPTRFGRHPRLCRRGVREQDANGTGCRRH